MPSWKKVIISGSDAALNSLDITGDLTVDTNTLYIDSANNRVGIGTTSPSQKLTVEGDITGSGYVKGSTLYALDDVVVGDQILHYGDTDTNLSFTTDKIQINAGGVEMITLTEGAADNVHINAGAVDMDFKVSTDNDNDALFVEGSTDRVGIGTGTPSEKLDVNGNASISGSLTVSQGGNFTMDGGGTLDTGGGTLNTTGGSINTSGGNINLGVGALNGTIPGSAVNVDTVTATVKNFVIDHPSEEKAGYKLRHSSLEGPEIGVYFRGKSTENIIDLPDYWKDLVDEDSITVNLTSFGSPCQHYIEDIRDNQVIIGCACGTPNYHFTVYGERKDVEKLVVEYKEEKYL